MPQFIYILQLQPQYRKHENWTDETNAILGEHWNYLVGMHQNGKITLVGRTEVDISNEDNRGIAVFEAEDIEEATAIMKGDPCVAKGVMTAQVFPFSLALFKGVPLSK
ncbi:MAG: YciI family protein [Chitinophagales bacterium]